MSRRVNLFSQPALFLLLLLCARCVLAADQLFLEAENFDDCGGWVVDQQFMDQMGSPYLLAHGLGDPVRDAVTVARFPAAGRYHVWVRTRDWVAPWHVPGTPGKFQILINGKALSVTFGIEGAEWHWQDGGVTEVKRETKVSLHDLTGFEGRCDAIVFCKDLRFQPPNDPNALASYRRSALGLPDQPEDGGRFDLVVVGGGIAGSSAALSAARLGLSVALVQDRPVLGGNGSSEVRVWPEGKINQAPYPRIGDVVAELVADRTAQSGNAKPGELYDDARKLAVVRGEPRIKLFLEQRVNEVLSDSGRVRAIVAQNIRTARRVRLAARWFADCTGDGAIGFLAGADHEITSEEHMGASNLWRLDDTGAAEPFPKCLCEDTNALNTAFATGKNAAPFPRCPWAVNLANKPFPGRLTSRDKASKEPLKGLGAWFWESGFDRDPIADVEWMRDSNLRAMYGAWDTLKNVDHLYPNHKLSWGPTLQANASPVGCWEMSFCLPTIYERIEYLPMAHFLARGESTFTRQIGPTRKAMKVLSLSRSTRTARVTPIRDPTGRRTDAFTAATSRIFLWPAATSA